MSFCLAQTLGNFERGCDASAIRFLRIVTSASRWPLATRSPDEKNSRIRWIAATSANFCPRRGDERAAIMYLWVYPSITFALPYRRGYRPLAYGLKSYRFLARSIRCPRWGTIFFSFFGLLFRFSVRFLLGFSREPLPLVTVYGSEKNARPLKKKVIGRFLSLDWLFRSEKNSGGGGERVSKYRPCVPLQMRVNISADVCIHHPVCLTAWQKYSGRRRIKNVAFGNNVSLFLGFVVLYGSIFCRCLSKRFNRACWFVTKSEKQSLQMVNLDSFIFTK